MIHPLAYLQRGICVLLGLESIEESRRKPSVVDPILPQQLTCRMYMLLPHVHVTTATTEFSFVVLHRQTPRTSSISRNSHSRRTRAVVAGDFTKTNEQFTLALYRRDQRRSPSYEGIATDGVVEMDTATPLLRRSNTCSRCLNF